MRNWKIAALFGVALLASSVPLRAAPDNKLGMALMSASVNDTGTILWSSGVTNLGTAKVGTGEYFLTFERKLLNCSCAATIGGPAAVPPQNTGITASCPRSDGPDAVSVYTSVGNIATDLPFHLIVFCPK